MHRDAFIYCFIPITGGGELLVHESIVPLLAIFHKILQQCSLFVIQYHNNVVYLRLFVIQYYNNVVYLLFNITTMKFICVYFLFNITTM